MASYEQTLKLFAMYLKDTYQIDDAKKVQSGHIRHYIKYLQERGKYVVASDANKMSTNNPHNRQDYKKQISRTTIANYTRNIKVFFNYLHTIEREITKNPCETIENIKPDRKQKKFITQEDFMLLLRQFDTSKFHNYRNVVVLKLLMDTGARISEALAITAEHIDFNHKSILIVNPKNKQQRYVYFSPKLANELKSWMKYKDRYSNSVYMFPTTKGTQLDIRNFEKQLKEAGERVNLSVHPHLFRNSFAKHYILNSGDWFSLCKILGHSSVEVTMKSYLDFTDEEIGRKYQQHSPLANMDI